MVEYDFSVEFVCEIEKVQMFTILTTYCETLDFMFQVSEVLWKSVFVYYIVYTIQYYRRGYIDNEYRSDDYTDNELKVIAVVRCI